MAIFGINNEKAKELLIAQAERLRQSAFKEEADPLFFQFQRGSIKKQVWLDKVEEIKRRYPKPE